MSGQRVFTTAGRTYWIDLFDRNDDSGRGDGRQIFADWVKASLQAFPDSVTVLQSQDFPDSDDDEPKQWVKFRTDVSLPWTSMVPFLGVPTALANPDAVKSRDDVFRGETTLTNEQKDAATRNKLIVAGVAVLGLFAIGYVVSPPLTAWLSNRRK